MIGDALQDSEWCTEHMVVSSLRLNCCRKFKSLACMDSIDTWECKAKCSVIREEAKH